MFNQSFSQKKNRFIKSMVYYLSEFINNFLYQALNFFRQLAISIFTFENLIFFHKIPLMKIFMIQLFH